MIIDKLYVNKVSKDLYSFTPRVGLWYYFNLKSLIIS